jgi:iron complex transport system ATP-binding protein
MNPVALQALGVSVRRGPREVVRHVSCALSQGELVGLVGPNGGGKSTLLQALAGHLPIQSGEVRLLERSSSEYGTRSRARVLAYLPQQRQSLVPLKVRQVVALGRLPFAGLLDRFSVEDARVVEEAMSNMGVSQLADRAFTALSGGEQARVQLARAFASQPRVLIADEPTTGLDPLYQLQLMNALRGRAREGCAVLVTLHDLALASRFCDRIVLLDSGAVRAQGAPREVLTPMNLEKTYGISARYLPEGDDVAVIPWDLSTNRKVGNG